jgi:hypothetical protein
LRWRKLFAKELLKGFSRTLHSNKYGAYETLENKKQYTWCHCMAHCRSNFFDIQSGGVEFKEWFLAQIQSKRQIAPSWK